jgi:heme O synthase-like polyprenyltransferase
MIKPISKFWLFVIYTIAVFVVFAPVSAIMDKGIISFFDHAHATILPSILIYFFALSRFKKKDPAMAQLFWHSVLALSCVSLGIVISMAIFGKLGGLRLRS